MKLYYLVLILLLIPFSYGIDAGEDYTLTTAKCYGDILIKFRSEQPLTENEYSFKDCKQQDEEYWNCKCNNGKEKEIILTTKNKTKNIYDIKLTYYIQPKILDSNNTKANVINDNNKRTKDFTNLIIGPAPKIKKPFVMPETKTLLPYIIIIVLLGIISISVIGYMIYKMFFKTYEPQKEYKTEPPKNNMTDEEMLEYIRNNFK